MHRILKNSKVLTVTLAASLAAFGCTTNWTRSDGEPLKGSNVNAPSATPGSAGGSYPQPMTSSSSITTNTLPVRTPSEALAIMRGSVATGQKGKVLGPSAPPNLGAAVVGGNVTPELGGTPQQLTINSSISNPYGPQAAVISGAGGSAADVAPIIGGTATGTTATATTSATSTGTLTPTAAAATVPLTTAATSPLILGNTGMLSSSSVTNGNTTAPANRVTTSSATNSGGVTSVQRLSVRSVTTTPNASGITVTQKSGGKITISNQK